MTAISVDNLVKSFEKPKIPPIDGKPMFTTIHSLYELLNSNVASVSTKLRWGMLGNLCLTLSPTFYATLLATQVVPPPNPGAAPVIPAGST